LAEESLILPIHKRVARGGLTALRWFFDKFGYRLQRVEHLNVLEPLLHRRLARAPEFFFVQIGANDGVFQDPIWEFVTRNDVAGLVVEPLPDVFEQLAANYRPYPKVTAVNTAIHASLSAAEMYRVDPARLLNLEAWARGIGSFNRQHHVDAGVPADAMRTETVPCMTLEALLQQHGVEAIDLLQIDTEGYDAEIIRMIDFRIRRPAIIHFEHGLPNGIMTPAEFKQCASLLMDNGYLLATAYFDAVAYRPEMV
jgi:FkbM family methyltransferase